MCGEKDETVTHIISGCSKLAQNDYKRRHDWVGKATHWDICKHKGFQVTDKWYTHETESVVENDYYKILWDFDVQTDHEISARRPDLIIINKEKKTCQIVDFAIPADNNIIKKEKEKEKYQDLKWEVMKLWNLKTSVIPIVIGALGTISKNLCKN